jgi:hypothetical protein
MPLGSLHSTTMVLNDGAGQGLVGQLYSAHGDLGGRI